MHMPMQQHNQIVDKTNNFIIQYQEWCCNVQHMQTAMLHHMHCHSKQTLNSCMSQQTQHHQKPIQSRGKNQHRHPIGTHCNISATTAHNCWISMPYKARTKHKQNNQQWPSPITIDVTKHVKNTCQCIRVMCFSAKSRFSQKSRLFAYKPFLLGAWSI